MKFWNALREALVCSVNLAILVVKVLLTLFFCLLLCFVPKKTKSLKDEVVLITGAGRGLGRMLAIKFASQKAKVILWDINEAEVKMVATEITSRGDYARAYVCDVTCESDVTACARRVEAEVGDVSLLVNNAGVLQNLPISELNSARIRQTIEVNLIAHFWTIRAFLPKMLEKNNGHIAAIASLSGLIGTTHYSDYCASKFGTVGLMESLAEEIHLTGKAVACTTVCPAAIDTGLIQKTSSRNSWLLPVLSVEDAAAQTFTAIRRKKTIVSIPGRMLSFINLFKMLPSSMVARVLDYAEYCRVPNSPKKETFKS